MLMNSREAPPYSGRGWVDAVAKVGAGDWRLWSSVGTGRRGEEEEAEVGVKSKREGPCPYL